MKRILYLLIFLAPVVGKAQFGNTQLFKDSASFGKLKALSGGIITVDDSLNVKIGIKYEDGTFQKTAASNSFTSVKTDTLASRPGGTGNILLRPSGIDALFLKSDGNVGINQTSPTAKLHLVDTWNSAKNTYLFEDSETNAFFSITDAASGVGVTAPVFIFESDNITGLGGRIVGSVQVADDAFPTGSENRAAIAIEAREADLSVLENANLFSVSNFNIGKFIINHFGRVGIIREIPIATLDIQGLGNTSGDQALRVTSNNSNPTLFCRDDNRVGIRTESPTATIHAVGTSDLSGDFVARFQSASSDVLVVENNGNVGIGTSTPARKFIITDAAANPITVHRPSSSLGFGMFTSYALDNTLGNVTDYARIQVLIGSNVGDNVEATKNGSLVFQTATSGSVTEKYRIDNDGDFRVSTGSNDVFNVFRNANTATFGTGILFKLNNSANSKKTYGQVFSVIETNTAGSEDGSLRFATTGAGTLTERVKIDGVGNVAIGIATATARLHVKATDDLSTGFAARFQNASGIDILKVENDEKVVVGDVAAQGKFTVADASANTTTTFGFSDVPIVIRNTNSTNNNWSFIDFQNGSGTGVALFGIRNVNHSLSQADFQWRNGVAGITHRMSLTHDGLLGLGTDIPSELFHMRKDQNAPTSFKIQNNNGGASAFSQLIIQADGAGQGVLFRNPTGTTTYGGANSLNIGTIGADPFSIVTQNTSKVLVTASGQVGIKSGITSVDASALLDVSSTTKGFLPPRMTSVQRDAIVTPASGLMVYDETNDEMDYFNGTNWRLFVNSGSTTLTDGSLIFATGRSAVDDNNDELFWDNINFALGIGTNTPNASCALDITSTTKGLLFPRLTTTQRDAIGTPASGLTVFNTITGRIEFFEGTNWVSDIFTKTEDMEFVGKGIEPTKPVTVIFDNVIVEQFSIDDAIHMVSLPKDYDSGVLTVKISFIPMASETGKEVQWKISYLTHDAGETLAGTTGTISSGDINLGTVVKIQQSTSFSIPAVDVKAALHVKVERIDIDTGTEPSTKPAISHVSISYQAKN
ncbi:hypothetical protein JYU20_00475 [Bacteroidales bacterium AH-315-I05]|nr:hypothetical protein [Bacteroidales bacterium AH-315-I05]